MPLSSGGPYERRRNPFKEENLINTKIVCTLGPSTEEVSMIKKLISAGMSVARLNFSHGTHQYHQALVERVRRWPSVAVLQDLQGIKIRITDVQEEVVLKQKQEVRIKQGHSFTTRDTIFIDYPGLLRDLKPGHRVFIDDGNIKLKVQKKTRDHIIAVVLEGGPLKSHKGVNLPDTKISISPFTDKDREDLDFGLSIGVDYVALSFVTSEREVKNLKDYMVSKGFYVPVIAKIERPEALSRIDRIIMEADGIMVARGDLGVEVPLEEIPIIQKDLIRRASEAGKVVITATQMLESMIYHSSPTRAETTDVANAVIDGSDALMLSGETSVGRYPVQAVRTMAKIIRYTERHIREVLHPAHRPLKLLEEDPVSFSVAEGAVKTAENLNASSIVALTRSGFTARIISKLRPSVPVIALTPDEKTLRKLALYWAVVPMMMDEVEDTKRALERATEIVRSSGVVPKSRPLVIVAGDPPGQGRTNLIKVIK
ncbi:MAG: pyruvate kinase [Nitrospirae bacterium]|nr:MAG: pyruvate kinase [Nitrospirota bacterium]